MPTYAEIMAQKESAKQRTAQAARQIAGNLGGGINPAALDTVHTGGSEIEADANYLGAVAGFLELIASTTAPAPQEAPGLPEPTPEALAPSLAANEAEAPSEAAERAASESTPEVLAPVDAAESTPIAGVRRSR